jgi:hypothetical protein
LVTRRYYIRILIKYESMHVNFKADKRKRNAYRMRYGLPIASPNNCPSHFLLPGNIRPLGVSTTFVSPRGLPEMLGRDLHDCSECFLLFLRL